jgi:hypothetical protein
LVIAEEILDGLEALAQARGWLAQHGLDGLGGVTQPFGGLAGFVQGQVAVTVQGSEADAAGVGLPALAGASDRGNRSSSRLALCPDECEREVGYCPECLHEAAERNAEAGLAYCTPETRLMPASSQWLDHQQ